MTGNKKAALFLDLSHTKISATGATSSSSGTTGGEDRFRSAETGGSWNFNKQLTPDPDSLSLFSEDLRLTTTLGNFNSGKNFNLGMNGDNIERDIQNNEGVLAGPEFLVWNNPYTPPSPIYPPEIAGPYVILMESTIKALNVGKLSPIKIADLIGEITEEELSIQRSGQNQVKITCQMREVANLILRSELLTDRNFRVYIPNSIIQKKGLIKEVDAECSAESIAARIRPEHKENLMSIKRRVDMEGNILDSMELTFLEKALPDIIPIKRFEFPVTPIIPKPTRCFRCQRYRHIAGQCRSHPRCEFCGQLHNTQECRNALMDPSCCNCGGAHLASSKECPVYIREDRIVVIKSENSCSYKNAEEIFKKRELRESSEQRENLSGEEDERSSNLTSDIEMQAESLKNTAQEALLENITNHHPFERSGAEKTVLEMEIQSPPTSELNSNQTSTPKRIAPPEGAGSPGQRDNNRKKVRQKSPN